jgi:uncharacterized protein
MFTAQPLRQDWSQPLPKYWLDNSPAKSHIMNAMGITFPIGEKFFIDSIRPYKDAVTDAKLLEEIKEFIKQENWHSYAHQQYNLWLEGQQLPVGKIYNDWEHIVNTAKIRYSANTQLAITICLEHITAIMAANALRNRSFYKLMHPHFEEIWRWHNVEEIEHKAVTMDIWNNINGKSSTLHLVMICVTILFWYKTLRYTIALLHADQQLWRWRNLYDAWDILFAKNGMIRSGLRPWAQFFKKNFHPNDHDDTKLLRNYRKL